MAPGSLAQELATYAPALFGRLCADELSALEYHWPFWARPSQRTPVGAWRIWLILAGRGWGKTRTGAEWIREEIAQRGVRRVALVGATAADVRDVMLEGESGLLNIFPPGERPRFEPSKRRVTWPNGAQATLYAAEEPERLRGPQHEIAWCDELAAWRYLDATWSNLMMGLRLGTNPRALITTTPKPIQFLRDLLEQQKQGDPLVVTRGATKENAANLAPAFLEQIVKSYEGTRLGRQELDGEILDDVPGALFKKPWLDEHRRAVAPEIQRLVVAVDPAITANDRSDETGIVVVGKGFDKRGYVLSDLSGRLTPDQWGRRVLKAYRDWQADCIVAETNKGGDMVVAILKGLEPTAHVKVVRAARGKANRAEPIAALYERGLITHVGKMGGLEDQMLTWDPQEDDSPDRLDALVWGLTELFLGTPAPTLSAGFVSPSRRL